MILVDIEVPSIEQVFDFELDEQAPLREVIQQVVSLITEKEGLKETDAAQMLLYSCRHEKFLNTSRNLEEQGIWTGQRLMLI